jgi:hypothetical protein
LARLLLTRCDLDEATERAYSPATSEQRPHPPRLSLALSISGPASLGTLIRSGTLPPRPGSARTRLGLACASTPTVPPARPSIRSRGHSAVTISGSRTATSWRALSRQDRISSSTPTGGMAERYCEISRPGRFPVRLPHGGGPPGPRGSRRPGGAHVAEARTQTQLPERLASMRPRASQPGQPAIERIPAWLSKCQGILIRWEKRPATTSACSSSLAASSGSAAILG